MVCTNCGQDLNEGVKFCTRCGKKCYIGFTGKANILSFFSLIFSIVGIIGLIVLSQIITNHWENWSDTQNWRDTYNSYWNIIYYFSLSLITGIIFAVLTLFKRKCKLAFIVGLVSCAYFVLAILSRILPFMDFLRTYMLF